MHAVGTDDTVSGRCSAVFETHEDWRAGLVSDGFQTFVEMAALDGNGFDELVEKVRSVDGFHSNGTFGVVDDFILVNAFTLK